MSGGVSDMMFGIEGEDFRCRSSSGATVEEHKAVHAGQYGDEFEVEVRDFDQRLSPVFADSRFANQSA